MNIGTCLWFDGQSEEAANFYIEVFPESRIDRTARMGGKVLTVAFTLAGRSFVALNGGPHYAITPAISLVIPCENQPEIDRYWTLLLEGGKAQRCGWLTDRFGVSWQIIPAALPELMTGPNANNVAKAMMKMTKFDIAELEAANVQDATTTSD